MGEPSSLLGPLLGEIPNQADLALQGVNKILDFTGLKAAPGKIEKVVGRTKEFVESQLDGIFHGILAMSQGTTSAANRMLDSAESQIETGIERLANEGETIALTSEQIRNEIFALVPTTGKIFSESRRRSSSLRKFARDVSNRAASLPREASQHLHQILVETEIEVLGSAQEIDDEAIAAETEIIQVAASASDQALFASRSVRQALTADLAQAKQLRDGIKQEVRSLANWGSSHVRRVNAFRSSRVQQWPGLTDPFAIETWATESVEGARDLAQSITEDIAKKPDEVRWIGQQKVKEAMNLFHSVEHQVTSARDWVKEQSSPGFGWRGAVRNVTHSAYSLFAKQEQRARVKIHQLSDAAAEAFHGQTSPGIDLGPLTERFLKEAGDWSSIPDPPSSKIGIPDSEINAQIDIPNVDLPIASDAEYPPNKQNNSRKVEVMPPAQAKAKSSSTQPPRSNPNKKKPGRKAGHALPPPQGLAASEIEQPNQDKESPDSPKTNSIAFQDLQVHGKAPEIQLPSAQPLSIATLSGTAESQPPEQPPTSQTPRIAPASISTNVKKSKSTKPQSKSSPISEPPVLGGPPSSSPTQTIPGTVPTTSGTTPRPETQALKSTPTKSPEGLQKNSSFETFGLEPTTGAAPDSEPSQPKDAKGFRDSVLAESGSGRSPDPPTKQMLAGHLGFDISGARFHTGPVAADAARKVKADAFTVGRDVFFGANKYDPNSPTGLGLIAHELTHVGQQMGLGSDKLRFATKTGGDVMEQEAQEVGERVASNLNHPAGLRVGSYLRTYAAEDDETLSHGTQQRLDRLSILALNRAGNKLAVLSRARNIRLDEVQIDLCLDLESSSDQEIIEEWAEAICFAVGIAPTDRFVQQTEDRFSSLLVQKRLGNDTEVGHLAKQRDAVAAMEVELSKIKASPEEKEIIRKLFVRGKLDSKIKSAKKRRSKFSLYDLTIFAGLDSGSLKNLKTLEFGDDEDAVLKQFAMAGISSSGEYELLEKHLLKTFVDKGLAATHFMLDQNLAIIEKEIMHYWGSGTRPAPNAEFPRLQEAAKTLDRLFQDFKTQFDKFATEENNFTRFHPSWKRKTLPMATPENMLQLGGALRPTLFQDGQLEVLKPMWESWSENRKSLGQSFPILMGTFKHSEIANSTDSVKLLGSFMDYLWPIKYDILEVKSKLNEDKFWELSKMVELTKQNLGIHRNEGADLVIQEYAKDKREDEAMWSMIKAAATIALAIAGTIATGGLAAVAAVGSAALSVHSAYDSVQNYQFGTAATDTAIDKAKRISSEDPSLFWMVVDLLGAAVDVGAATGALAAISKSSKAIEAAKAAKSAKAEAKAIEDLDEAARSVYRKGTGMKMTEDEFVARVFESARRGTKIAEDTSHQMRVVTELLEGTSKRVIGLYRGDPDAITSLLHEHGNWKGLMSALNESGDEAKAIAHQLHTFREDLVTQLDSQGFKRLSDSSAGPLSDYDLSVFPDEGSAIGAGEKLINKEKEMVAAYGDNWKEAFDINFYTNRDQLLAVDQALAHANAGHRAAILRRVTADAEKLNFAKMLEHAGHDPDAIARIQGYMKSAGVKYDLEELRELGNHLHGIGRDSVLLDIDEHMKQLKKVPAGSDAQVALSEEITRLQMQANFLSNEAYIGPASIKGGNLSAMEAHQVAVSQLEMIEHVISTHSGDVLRAARNYEFHKYVSRYIAAAKQAGIDVKSMEGFERLSKYVYKNSEARSALQYTGQFSGVTPANEVLGGVIDANYIKQQFDGFMDEVKTSLPKIKQAASEKSAKGWKGSGPGPGPTGAPPNAPPAPPGLPPPPTPPAPPSAAASPPPVHQVTEVLDNANKLSSAGFGGSGTGTGVGVFRTTLPGIDHPVVVKTYLPGKAAKMEAELNAAVAAEKTGIGPKIYGKVSAKDAAGNERIGFAMDEVKGGFADDFADAADEAEMLRNAQNINENTFKDVDLFEKKMLDQGYYYKQDLQGFVDEKGHWKPIDFQSASPLPMGDELPAALASHQESFDAMKEALRDSWAQADAIRAANKSKIQ